MKTVSAILIILFCISNASFVQAADTCSLRVPIEKKVTTERIDAAISRFRHAARVIKRDLDIALLNPKISSTQDRNALIIIFTNPDDERDTRQFEIGYLMSELERVKKDNTISYWLVRAAIKRIAPLLKEWLIFAREIDAGSINFLRDRVVAPDYSILFPKKYAHDVEVFWSRLPPEARHITIKETDNIEQVLSEKAGLKLATSNQGIVSGKESPNVAGKGSLLQFMYSAANNNYFGGRPVTLAELIAIRIKDREGKRRTLYSRTQVQREIVDAIAIGILTTGPTRSPLRGKTEIKTYIFNIRLSKEQIDTLPADIRADLDRYLLVGLAGKDRIKEAIALVSRDATIARPVAIGAGL